METQVQSQTEIVKTVTKSALTINAEKGVYAGTYQKPGTMSVELRQVVTTTGLYPSKRASNNLNDSLFNNEDFGFEVKPMSNDENRVGWINVPAGTTLEQVQAKLAAATGATLYKILSNRPILTEDQEYTLRVGTSTKTMADYADSQVVRYPELTNGQPHPKAGQIVLDPNGKVQYRSVFFSAKSAEDMDKRNSNPTDFYATDAITAELAASGATVVANQGL